MLLLIAINISILISFLCIDAFDNRNLTLRKCIDYHKNAIEICDCKANIEFLYKCEENLNEIQNFNKIISNKLK